MEKVFGKGYGNGRNGYSGQSLTQLWKEKAEEAWKNVK